MKKAFESRELVAITQDGRTLYGTYHKSCHKDGSGAGYAATNPVALLFLNYGSMPRSGTADTTVHWANSASKLGYPSFRFDAPGLGDSQGDLPKEMSGYVEQINSGNYTSPIANIAETITERFNLAGVIVVGHCAGAVAAVYAAGACDSIKGLILLTPYFYRPTNSNLRLRIHFWGLESKVGQHLRGAYRRFKHTVQQVQLKGLPNNANTSLVRCWKRLASSGLPMLILTRDEPKLDGGFDYLEHLGARSHRSIAIKSIASHSFVEGVGKKIAWKQMEDWLPEYFASDEDGSLAKVGSAEKDAHVRQV
jgi:pimeloyl-ACP methyl ester carboxylesterase